VGADGLYFYYAGGRGVNETEVLKNALDRHMTEHTDQMREQNKLFREILDRVIGVETHQKIMLQSCPTCQTEINKQGKELVEIGARAKSAHHRIDSVYTSAGIVSGIVSAIVVGIFALLNYLSQLSTKGGH